MPDCARPASETWNGKPPIMTIRLLVPLLMLVEGAMPKVKLADQGLRASRAASAPRTRSSPSCPATEGRSNSR